MLTLIFDNSAAIYDQKETLNFYKAMFLKLWFLK